MRRSVILLSALLSLLSTVFADTIIPGGYVSGIWAQSGSPYLIQGDLAINSTSTLTIEPGVEVLFQGYYRLLCEGRLLAVGTVEDSIIFKPFAAQPNWDGIDLINLNLNILDSTRLEYCYFEKAMASRRIGIYNLNNGGAIYLFNSSKITLSDCLFEDNCTIDRIGSNGANGTGSNINGMPGESVSTGSGGAIFCLNSNPIITSCIFANNHTGNANGGNGGNGYNTYITFPSGDVYGGEGGFGGSAQSGSGGALYILNSSPIIKDNIFKFNYTGSAFSGDGGIGGNASFYEGNYIAACGGNGGHGGSGIAGDGGAFHSDSSGSQVNNNLFYGNFTGDGYGGNGGNGGNASSGFGYPNWEDPGLGGDGGYGMGGEGGAFRLYSLIEILIQNITANDNDLGAGVGGSAGQNGNSGPFANFGVGQNGLFTVFVDHVRIRDSIIWGNQGISVNVDQGVIYSCIQGAYSGLGIINSDPLFFSCPAGDKFLSNVSAGQSVNSPCIDAGDPLSLLISGTTRIDAVADEGVIDMGFHYPIFDPMPEIIFSPDSLNFQVEYYAGNPLPQIFILNNS